MSKDTMLASERVARYNLTIVFEELYTRDHTQLQATADAISAVASAIEALVTTNRALQALLEVQNLRLNIIAPARVSTR